VISLHILIHKHALLNNLFYFLFIKN